MYVGQSKIPLIIDVAISITTALCTSQRIRFPLKQRYPLEIDLDASCYHATVNAKDTYYTHVLVHTPVRVMSIILFSQISNIQNNFKFEQSLHSLGPHHLCFFACTIKRWNQQKSFQRLKMGKKSRRHPENGEGHIGKQEGRDRPLPRIHILRKNREATCSEIRTSGTVISGSVS